MSANAAQLPPKKKMRKVALRAAAIYPSECTANGRSHFSPAAATGRDATNVFSGSSPESGQ